MKSLIGVGSNVIITVRDSHTSQALKKYQLSNTLTIEFLRGITEYLSGSYIVLDRLNSSDELQYMHSSLSYLPRCIVAGTKAPEGDHYSSISRVSQLDVVSDLSRRTDSDTNSASNYISCAVSNDIGNQTRTVTYNFYLSRESSDEVSIKSLALVSSISEDANILAILDTSGSDLKLSSQVVIDVAWSIILKSVHEDSVVIKGGE